MNRISALIPYKPDQGRRDELWAYVRRRYERFMPEVEVCVGTDEGELFCRARALNRAARQAGGNIFMLVDTDLVFESEMLERIRETVNRKPWVIPFSHAYRLTREATDRLMQEDLSETFEVSREEIEFCQVNPGAYLNVMTRACFEAIGGMDERFVGYGFEDSALALSCDTLCGPFHRTSGTIYHLWHPWAEFHHSNYANSLSLYQRYASASGDITKMRELIRERSYR